MQLVLVMQAVEVVVRLVVVGAREIVVGGGDGGACEGRLMQVVVVVVVVEWKWRLVWLVVLVMFEDSGSDKDIRRVEKKEW